MGLRSFIGRIKRHKKDDGDGDEADLENEYDQETLTSDSISALNDPTNAVGDDTDIVNGFGTQTNGDAWIPSMLPDSKPPVRMGEDPSSKEINVFGLDRAESVQERINRVKSGKMTDEEKQAYLRAALSSGSTPESRLPLRPPTSKADQDALERHTKPAPFPGDPIYRSIAGGKDSSSGTLSNDIVDRVGLDMQKRKRDYLDMVTDPHRFDVYRSAGLNLGRSASEDTDDYDEEQDPEINSETPKPIIDPLPSDLGERLGAAANAQEISRRKAEEEKRAKEKAKIESLNRRLGPNTPDSPAPAKDVSTGQGAEQEKMQELMKAQDDYWARKLASEREAAKERQMRMDEQQKFTFPGTISRSSSQRDAQQKKVSIESMEETVDDSAVSTNGENTAVDSDQASTFNPDESGLVDEDDSPPNGSARDRRFQPFSASDLNDVRNLKRPAYDGPKPRKRKTESNVDEQIRRLREMNSPLPNQAPVNGFPNRGVKQQRPVRFEPQRPVSASSSGTDRSSFNNLMKNSLNDSRDPAEKTRVLLNGFSGKTESSGNDADVKTENSSIPSAFEAASKRDKSKADGANPISMIFGGTTPKRPDDSSSKATDKSPDRSRKGPIRMQLPLGDDDDDDAVDTKANSGMSIAEAMKRTNAGGSSIDQDERSKKWGIDMSKFT